MEQDCLINVTTPKAGFPVTEGNFNDGGVAIKAELFSKCKEVLKHAVQISP